ncbi:MAG: DUF3883 domain-containing protein [Bacteroidia bacterium]|nr:DUF3883 domain-containing protein [Bacteroidia bacterium]
MSDSWSNIEVELIVADYFQMLSSELKGESYSKAEHRRALLPLLANRSDGSVEFKHQNISAVLINQGQPYIKGYLPRFNFQKILEEKVVDYLFENHKIEDQIKLFVEKEPIQQTSNIQFDKFIVDPPKTELIAEPSISYSRRPIKINYLEKEQNNHHLGRFGEELVLEYEKWNLIRVGKEKLADQVRWISNELGDGAGFDILSRNLNGTDKYIEVKTTRLGKDTPIFFSNNELQYSITNSDNFHLYRIFNFEKDTKMFFKNGALNKICNSVPIAYKGFF